MKRILLSMIVVLACGSIALAQNTKEERMKYIRKCYADAKKKVDANGKNGKSPKDMRLIINRLEDEDVPLYDTEQLDFFFDEKIVDGLATKQPPYFIVENWGPSATCEVRRMAASWWSRATTTMQKDNASNRSTTHTTVGPCQKQRRRMQSTI